LRELEEAGYLVRERVHIGHGRFDWVSTVYEVPQQAEQSTIDGFSGDGKKRTRKRNRPSTPLPSMVEPSTVNPSIYQGMNLLNSPNGEDRAPRKSADAPAPEETQPSPHQAIMQAYQQALGYPIKDGAKEGNAAKWLVKNGYTPEQ